MTKTREERLAVLETKTLALHDDIKDMKRSLAHISDILSRFNSSTENGFITRKEFQRFKEKDVTEIREKLDSHEKHINKIFIVFSTVQVVVIILWVLLINWNKIVGFFL